MKASSGAIIWQTHVPGSDSSPAVSGDLVFVNTTDGTSAGIAALYAPTGAIVWSKPVAPASVGVSAPAIAAGSVFVAAGRRMFALNAMTGAIRWHNRTRNSLTGPPIAANGVVYTASAFRIFVMAAKNGIVLWTRALRLRRSEPVVLDGRLYLNTGNIVFFGL